MCMLVLIRKTTAICSSFGQEGVNNQMVAEMK